MATSPTHRRIGAGISLAVAALIGPFGSADAAPPDESGRVARAPDHDTAYYPDVERGLVLFYGPTLGGGGCIDEGFPTTTLTTVERPDGTVLLRKVFQDAPLHVYESDDPFAFLFEQCDLLDDGDPETNPIAPIASGSGSLVMQWRIAPDGSMDVQNWVVGRIDNADGTTSPVRADARYSVSADGEEAFFRSLAVHMSR